ncbi:hypothetical protein EVAR_93298_1 [Eumeta japonica]|uniref:Uncharacterized protein n=1 Tax=Eumeta variegata TaxID=151549 RepID=A0A4C1USQ9_EUMVA|nr:hypothetical protein EVAR_93298_1 [Eumeta japonica]
MAELKQNDMDFIVDDLTNSPIWYRNKEKYMNISCEETDCLVNEQEEEIVENTREILAKPLEKEVKRLKNKGIGKRSNIPKKVDLSRNPLIMFLLSYWDSNYMILILSEMVKNVPNQWLNNRLMFRVAVELKKIMKIMQRLLEEKDILSQRLFRNLHGDALRARICHDIIESPDFNIPGDVRGKFLRSILCNFDENSKKFSITHRGRKYGKRGILLIAEHNEQLHIIHDCSCSNGTCRCKIIANILNYRKERRNTYPGCEFELFYQKESMLRSRLTEYEQEEAGFTQPSTQSEQALRKDTKYSAGQSEQQQSRIRRLRHYARRCTKSFKYDEDWWDYLASEG